MKRDQARISTTYLTETDQVIVRLTLCVEGTILFERQTLRSHLQNARRDAFKLARSERLEVVE